MKTTLISFIGLFITSISYAQLEDLTLDQDFFEEQIQTYQRWLDYSGLGQVLRVYEMEVEKDQVSLYLAFPYREVDSIVVAWKQLKEAFEASQALTLEKRLYYKMVDLMEVRQQLANVQIYDTYDLRKEPLFFRGIYFDQDEGVVKVETSDPRSDPKPIRIRKSDLAQLKQDATARLSKDYQREKLYELIFAYAEQEYEGRVCRSQSPSVDLLGSREELRFEVVNLCREVLADQSNPLLCQILQKVGYDCDWARWELLIFTIVSKDVDNEIELSITVDGKYGSGLYEKVGRGGYLDMEVDFDEELETYAEKFAANLKRQLMNE